MRPPEGLGRSRANGRSLELGREFGPCCRGEGANCLDTAASPFIPANQTLTAQVTFPQTCTQCPSRSPSHSSSVQVNRRRFFHSCAFWKVSSSALNRLKTER